MYTARDIFFLDFSLWECCQHDYDLWEELQTLFGTLHSNSDDNQGFWDNRHVMISDTKNIVIAIDNTTGKQLGFLYARPNTETNTVNVMFIEAFEQRKHVGSLLIEYLNSSRQGVCLVIDYPIADSYPFWAKILNKYPSMKTNTVC